MTLLTFTMKHNDESIQDLILGLQFVGASCFLGAALLGASTLYSGHAASAREKVNARPPGSVVHVYQAPSQTEGEICAQKSLKDKRETSCDDDH